MKKCEKCDVELVWLYKPLRQLYATHRDDDFSQTDYLMCPICEEIWKQWIETKVHRDEVPTNSTLEVPNLGTENVPSLGTNREEDKVE